MRKYGQNSLFEIMFSSKVYHWNQRYAAMIVDRWWRDRWSRSIWLINDLRLTIDQSWSRSTNIDDRRSTKPRDWRSMNNALKNPQITFCNISSKTPKRPSLSCSKNSKVSLFLRTSHFLRNFSQIDWKRCWDKRKSSKYCAHCLRAKLRFWELRSPFLRIQLIDNKQ